MASRADKIKARIHKGLVRAGTRTGSGEFTATLIQTVKSGDDADPTFTDTETTVTIIMSEFAFAQADGTAIRSGDHSVIMAATGAVPAAGDRLDVQGQTYAIVAVNPLAPGGEALMYECQIRS